MKNLFLLCLFAVANLGCQSSVINERREPSSEKTSADGNFLVIAHRGASGYRPEHTLEGYLLAIQMQADFIEPDLVMSKDGVLVVRHENNISDTTNVSEVFPERKATKVIDGETITGWFTEDFTLAELKQLKVRQRLKSRSQEYNDLFQIPTFEEVLQLVVQQTHETGRSIGIYPEAKHPTYFRSLGLPIEEPLLALLEKYHMNSQSAPVFIQSFEVGNLKRLSQKTSVRLVQLLGEGDEKPYDFVVEKDPRTYRDLLTEKGIAEIATYARAIGPSKTSLVKQDPKTKEWTADDRLVRWAHAHGLLVHPYTFRSDREFLAPQFHGNPLLEYYLFLQMGERREGVDGVFSDFPDVALQAAKTRPRVRIRPR